MIVTYVDAVNKWMLCALPTCVLVALTTVRLKEKEMERTNFENLQIYKLSETLSDQLWKIVFAGTFWRWRLLANN